MKTILKTLRANLKVLAAGIRAAKLERKTAPDGYVPGLAALQHEFRYKHIVRCLLRGKTLDQVDGGERRPAGCARRNPINVVALRREWLAATGLDYPKLPAAEVEDEALRAHQA